MTENAFESRWGYDGKMAPDLRKRRSGAIVVFLRQHPVNHPELGSTYAERRGTRRNDHDPDRPRLPRRVGVVSAGESVRRLTRRGYKREDARVWREEAPREDSAPVAPLALVARLEDWGVTREQAAAMLRERMCPACGRGPWGSVLTHVSKGHGIDRFTMRELCGLNTTEVLAATEVSEKRSSLSKAASEGRDMGELARRPRKKYRHTSAGVAALTANLDRDSLATPTARANHSKGVRAAWAAMTAEERSARMASVRRGTDDDG